MAGGTRWSTDDIIVIRGEKRIKDACGGRELSARSEHRCAAGAMF